MKMFNFLSNKLQINEQSYQRLLTSWQPPTYPPSPTTQPQTYPAPTSSTYPSTPGTSTPPQTSPAPTSTYYSTPTTTQLSTYPISPSWNFTATSKMSYPNTFPTYNGICTQSDTNTIYNCYLNKIFDFFDVPHNPYRFLNAYLEAVQDPNQVPGICSAKKRLDKCIGKSIIQKCFNIKDFRKIDFIESNQEARIMITNYLQLDYACGAVYNLLTEKLDCVLNAVGTCFGDYNSCTNAYGLISCGINKVKSNCGNPAGCFAQKYLSLQKCYYLSDCDFCESINYIYNPINNMCSEDSNYGGHHGGGSANLSFNNILFIILIAFYMIL